MSKWMIGAILASLLLAAPAGAQAQATAPPPVAAPQGGAQAAPLPAQPAGPVGQWVTNGGKSLVEVTICGPTNQGICANVVWLRDPNDTKGRPHTDVLNPNPALRKRPIIGLPLFENMRPKGTQRWVGRVYDPEAGESYDNVEVWLDAGGQLKLKGCVMMFCETHAWKRPT